MVLGGNFFNRLGARADSDINYPLIYPLGKWSIQRTVYLTVFSNQVW